MNMMDDSDVNGSSSRYGNMSPESRRGTQMERRDTVSGGGGISNSNQKIFNVIQKNILESGQSNLWKAILNDVTQRDDIKESHLLVLGDRGAGKKSLISAVNKHIVRATNMLINVDKMGSQYSALDSAFLYVKDLSEKDALNENEQVLPCMNVWMLQEQDKADLIKQVIKPDDLQHTCALIVLDFDQPWEMMNALQRWMGVLGETILDIMKLLKSSEQDKMKDRLTRFVKNFERKDDSNENSASPSKTKPTNKDSNLLDDEEKFDDDMEDFSDLKSRLPLPEGVLQVNLGIPIIVVCNKIDLLLRGDKSQLLEQNLEFIQKHLRSYCLSYAATLMFTESIQQTNIELLYRYILHRLYDQEFNNKAEILQKDAIFIPTGFDSLMLIEALCKGAYQEGKVYEEIIKKPSVAQQGQNKSEITCEDWQSLLQRQFGMRRAGGAGAGSLGQQQQPGQAAGGAANKLDEKQKKDMTGFFQGLINKGQRSKPVSGPGANVPGERRMPAQDQNQSAVNGQLSGGSGLSQNNPLARASQAQMQQQKDGATSQDILQSLRDRHSAKVQPSGGLPQQLPSDNQPQQQDDSQQ